MHCLQIRNQLGLSFHNNRSFLQKIDSLPTGPKWSCERVKVRGNARGVGGEFVMEEVELWKRDPVECVRELLGNPTFREHITYTPERVFADGMASQRIYDEMWTGDWWWDMQVSICDLCSTS